MRILIPVDFSPQSYNACRYALHLAAKVNAEIYLLNCFYDPFIDSDNPMEGMGGSVIIPSSYLVGLQEEAKNSMDKLLEDLVQYEKDHQLSSANIKVALKRGFPEFEILEFSKKMQPDLLIMGTNASEKGGLHLFGSVTAKIMTNGLVPLLAIPSNCLYREIKNIMYATDFEPADIESIQKLIRIFGVTKPDILCVHVQLENEEPWTIDEHDENRKFFASNFPEHRISFDLVGGKNLIEGADYYVAEKSIDLISFTTHKRNIITRLIKPSQTKKMLMHTHTPLLAFHTDN